MSNDENRHYRFRVKRKNLGITLVILIIAFLSFIGLYQLWYEPRANEASTPTIYQGMLGFTLAPGGAGLADRLVDVPVTSQLLNREGGSSFSFGPWEKTRKVHAVGINSIVSVPDTGHSYTFLLRFSFVGQEGAGRTITIDKYEVPGDGQLHKWNVSMALEDVVIPAGYSGSIDILHESSVGLEQKFQLPVQISTDSSVWFEVSEARVAPPDTAWRFLKDNAFKIVPLAVVILPFLWPFITVSAAEKTTRIQLATLTKIESTTQQQLSVLKQIEDKLSAGKQAEQGTPTTQGDTGLEQKRSLDSPTRTQINS